MTDQHEHEHDEQHDDVRRLLADARHDEPIPTDVADRLDRVLAGLAAGGTPTDDEPVTGRAPVVDLAAQRRRSRARNLLVAAAAVVAVGVGIAQLDLDMSGSGDGAGSSAGMDAPASVSDDDSQLESGAGRPSERAADVLEPGTGRERAASQLMRSTLVVTDADFADVASRKALTFGLTDGTSNWLSADTDQHESLPTPPQGASAVPEDTDSGTTSNDSYEATLCGPGPYGNGSLLLVTYRRHPAVLAVRPREGDSTVVDLLRCGTGEVLRSSTVPTP